MSDTLYAAMAGPSPKTRDLLCRVSVRDEGVRGATSVFGEGGDGDYLIDDLIYAINRQTLDPDEQRKVVGMLDELAESE